MITVSKEDYLKAILEAESEGETVISATLAHWLSVSPPAVTMALRRLKKDGLVRVQNGGEVSLTAAGRKIARKLTLRHHLIERMLAEMFGMEWYKVHDEAERLEHAVSPDFEAKLLAKLGRGGACPHGNLSERKVPPAGAGAACCCCREARRASVTGSAGSTSATAICWNFWKRAASGLGLKSAWSSVTTTRHSPSEPRPANGFGPPRRRKNLGFPLAFPSVIVLTTVNISTVYTG